MNPKNQQLECFSEDEIDLKELFLTIKKYKSFIFLFTLIITLVAVIYIVVKIPLYEANGIIELGYYKDGTKKISFDNPSSIIKELDFIFIQKEKDKKDTKSKVTAISLEKGVKNLIKITTEGVSNDLASKKIEEILTYLQKKYQQNYQDIKKRYQNEIESIQKREDEIKNKTLPLLTKQIELTKRDIKTNINFKKSLDKSYKKAQKSNPAFATLLLMKEKDIENYILQLKQNLIHLENQKSTITTKTLYELKLKKDSFLTLLQPNNLQNFHLIGDILTLDHPVKPKKKLIVAIAFITGLILSIFLIFFYEFIKGLKDEEEKS
ncbi:chain length determinant protein [hydrothermal vent metagenome]|uniref:Chain length determinant protein n=1 Tax=hydrothermal vent metagenome TaxID=652676 RepID=A0A1W1BHP1_9ZZZZ